MVVLFEGGSCGFPFKMATSTVIGFWIKICEANKFPTNSRSNLISQVNFALLQYEEATGSQVTLNSNAF